MRILNSPPTAHTPEQKRDARSKAAPNPPARPRRPHRGASERSRCSGAETSARRGPTPRRRRRETGSAGAAGGHGRGAAARTERGACGANVGGERERPASEIAEGSGLIGAATHTGEASDSDIRD